MFDQIKSNPSIIRIWTGREGIKVIEEVFKNEYNKYIMKKAIIKKVSHGKLKGQFRFVLVGANGEPIATSEIYTQKHNVTELLQEHFADFIIVDKTK